MDLVYDGLVQDRDEQREDLAQIVSDGTSRAAEMNGV